MKASELRPGQFCTGIWFQLQSVIADQSEWSQQTFGSDATRGPIGALKHLLKEAQECVDNPRDMEERADVFLLLLDAQRRSGWTFGDLVNAAEAKMKKNKARQWPKPTSDEPVEHVKPAPLQLREGVEYISRDGSYRTKVKPIGSLADDFFQWRGIGSSNFSSYGYSDTGRIFTKREDDHDLIAEVPPPVADDFKAKALGAMKRGSDRVLKGKHPDECEFGQEVCLNCGWDKGGDLPKSLVDFDANGDAICPECGHNACYFDSRDEVPPPVEPSTQPAPAPTSSTNCKAESTSEAGEKFTNKGVNSLQPDADGWIEWKGGKCPVGESQRVDVRFRRQLDKDPSSIFSLGSEAFEWDWSHADSDSDIVAYRLVQPAPITHWVEVVYGR